MPYFLIKVHHTKVNSDVEKTLIKFHETVNNVMTIQKLMTFRKLKMNTVK